MAELKFNVLQKPLEERMIDAACIYWEVNRDFFMQKNKSGGNSEKRHILFYMLQWECGLSGAEIAMKFERDKKTIFEAVDGISVRKNINPTISHAIRDINKIAANLEVEMVTVDVKLKPKSVE